MLNESAKVVRNAAKIKLESGRAMNVHYDHPILFPPAPDLARRLPSRPNQACTQACRPPRRRPSRRPRHLACLVRQGLGGRHNSPVVPSAYTFPNPSTSSEVTEMNPEFVQRRVFSLCYLCCQRYPRPATPFQKARPLRW
jgi:hypothetical protein